MFRANIVVFFQIKIQSAFTSTVLLDTIDIYIYRFTHTMCQLCCYMLLNQCLDWIDIGSKDALRSACKWNWSWWCFCVWICFLLVVETKGNQIKCDCAAGIERVRCAVFGYTNIYDKKEQICICIYHVWYVE